MMEKSNKQEVVQQLVEKTRPNDAAEQTTELTGGKTDIALEEQRTQIEKLKEEIEGLKQDRSQRKIFSYVIFGFMCVYMVAVLVAVYLNGFCVMYFPDSVMVTLLTTSLANVIGIFNFVAKYLFHTKN